MLVALSFCDRIQVYVVLEAVPDTTGLMQVLSFQVSTRKWTSSKTEPQSFEAPTGTMINVMKNRQQRLQHVPACLTGWLLLLADDYD